MMEEKGVRKRGREHSRLNPATVEQEIGLGEGRRRERERGLTVSREGRESVTATNDGTYKRAATTLLRKWFVYYVVTLRSQANRR